MRWNCPHCGVALAVADEKLGAGWSFSKCYKCAKFALVRRSDVSLIKIDQAPAGERMVLPESTEHPQRLMMMNRQATERLNQLNAASVGAATMVAAPGSSDSPPLMAPVENKPVVRPAVRRRAARPADPAQQTQPPAPAAPAMGTGATAAGPAKPAYKIPPRAMIETRGHSVTHSAIIDLAASLPDPLPDDPKISLLRRLIPVAIAASALIAVASGVYLYIQAQRVWDRAREKAPVVSQHPESAAAPVDLAPAVAPAPAAPTQLTTTDQVHQNAMAPERALMKEEDEQQPPAALVVRARVANVKLRGGPGLQYPVTGLADPGVHYVVQEWKADWFRVALPAAPVDERTGKTPTAWVRNDLVSLITVD